MTNTITQPNLYTKADAVKEYRETILPHVAETYENSGLPNYPERLSAWTKYLDLLATYRIISALQHASWTPPVFISGVYH